MQTAHGFKGLMKNLDFLSFCPLKLFVVKTCGFYSNFVAAFEAFFGVFTHASGVCLTPTRTFKFE